MGYLIGRGRTARETYPGGNSNSSSIAQQNRNVAAFATMPGFTPATSPSTSPIAALLYTPKVSGIVEVFAALSLTNGGTDESYASAVEILSGTALSVSGGSVTSDGWVIGSTTPPIVGGSGITPVQAFSASSVTLLADDNGSLVMAGLSQKIAPGPLPIGVPVVIQIVLGELGGGNAIASLFLSQLSILELP